MTKPSNNFKSLLSDINELNSQETQQVFIPSLGRDVPFAPLTVKQQKKVLSSGVDTNIENLTFSNCMNSIITENIKDKNITIYTILAIRTLSIAVSQVRRYQENIVISLN